VPVLRINQQPGGNANQYRIDVSAEIPGVQSLSFSKDIEFELTRQDGERIRWYLEDYLQFDEDPAPQIAAQIEAFMTERGEALFRSIFEDSNESTRLWSLIEPHLSTARVEITTGIAEATAIPWELIRNPHTRTNLALSAQAFVRTQRGAQTTLMAEREAEKVRILLVICRPHGGADVPFRSVANPLVTRLNDDVRGAFDLDVLRPPTYEQLARALRLAKESGRPYHIVHFDGHGVYAEAVDRGLLAFEDPANQQNSEFVDGFMLGALLRDTSVRVLVLNACQSAFAEAPTKPREAAAGTTREEIEAYGSLAQAVMEAGVAGVVAMRYSVYVVTAAQFVAELYGALARGRQLGEAVTWARKNLHDQPDRQIAYEPRPLQDWSVPLVWERAPLRLWPEKSDAVPIKITLDKSEIAKPGALDQALPARPDVGFYGRDETLYALDRAFDTHRIVLLHAYAGSGKTATAAEFARWYALTGGIEGPVLFSSFERHLSLARVLDKIGVMFGQTLEQAGIHWDALTSVAQRKDIALQIMRQVPVLWIWDNVEPITSFPAGTASDWNDDEQQELRDFLRAARETKVKFLLTSRRAEEAWLGELPRRVEVPPMPMQERLQLASGIVAQRGRRLADLPDLTPLLQFTRGNPLTILVTVGAALRTNINTKGRLDTFVTALRGGEVDFEDEETEGRSKSLGASLSYGFATAFSAGEQKVLALLHLFQGFVDVDALRIMGEPEAEWCLEAVCGLSREQGITVLDRAAEIGLLERRGGGYYGIHPALPWYFRALFERYFPEDTTNADRARRAFVEAIAQLGAFYFVAHEEGNSEVIKAIAAEEDNLLAAWRLARVNGWWDAVITTMHGLQPLHLATGRSAAWRLLVDRVVPDFVDPSTDRPLVGREGNWNIVTGYRIRLAREDRDWAEAERLARLLIATAREDVQPALAVKSEARTSSQRNQIRTLAAALHILAELQSEQGNQSCAKNFREALDLAGLIGDVTAQAACAFNLGTAYKTISALRDLDEAERWFRKSLEMRIATDTSRDAKCFGQLGSVAYERFKEASAAGRSIEDSTRHLTDAARLYEQALDMFPGSALRDRGVTHNQLGNIYDDAGNLGRALYHYQQDIRYCELARDIYGAGQTRFNVAVTLLAADRLPDARAYAEAALINFQSFGDRAADQIQETEILIARLDKAMVEKGSGT
jgi:tetratricopeptide (TPR) repeat protein